MVNKQILLIFILDDSYFEILFVSKKLKSYGQGVSVKTKKAKLDNENNINFSNSKIEFMSINIDEDYIDIFLLHNSKKVNSSSSDSINYYRIITKDIGVKDDFKEINFTLINNIQIAISIKFKNKFSTQAISVKDRLKFFNQQKQEAKKPADNQYKPKKIKMPDFLQKDSNKKEEKKKR